MMDKARSPSLKTWDTCILMPFVVIIICICCTHCINHCINHTRHIHPEDRVQLSIHGYLCSRYVVHHPWTLFPNRLPFCYSYLPLVTFFTLVIIARLLYLLSHLSSYLCRAEELWDWNKGFVNHLFFKVPLRKCYHCFSTHSFTLYYGQQSLQLVLMM